MMRFLHHARRVRMLLRINPLEGEARTTYYRRRSGMSGWNDAAEYFWLEPIIEDSCFSVLRDFFGGRPALPALRYFCCDHDHISMVGMALFFAPTLRKLRFECERAMYPMGDMLWQLTRSSCAGSLRVLIFNKAREKHTSLKIHPEDFVAMANLPRLEELDFFLDSSLDFSTIGETLPSLPFPSLRVLRFDCGNILAQGGRDSSDGDAALRCISAVLRHLYSALQQLTFTVRTNASASRASVDELCTALGAYSASLTWCSIVLGVSTPATEPPLTIRSLAPLLGLPLCMLDFSYGALDIDLAGLQAIADACPRLVRLYLGQCSSLSAPRVPVDALPDIARRLPRLAGLGLVVHDDCGSLDDSVPELPTTRRLGGLVLGGGSALRDPARVARYLARCFPSSYPGLAVGNDDPVSKVWGEAVRDEKESRRPPELACTEPYERSPESEDEEEVWTRELRSWSDAV